MKDNKRITIAKDEVMNPTCNVCISDNDVKQVLFHCTSYGTGIVLCKDCRKALIKELIATTEFDSVVDFVSVLS